MLRTWLSSGARLTLLVRLALFPALALILYTEIDQRRHAARNGSGEAPRLANPASYNHNQRSFMAQAKGSCKTLSPPLQIWEASTSMCNHLLVLLESPYPYIAHFVVADLDAILLKSEISRSAPICRVDRGHIRRSCGHRFLVSAPIKSAKVGRSIEEPR